MRHQPLRRPDRQRSGNRQVGSKPIEALVGRWSRSQTSLERPPTLRGGLGSSPFPFITIAADGGCVELAGYLIFPCTIYGEDNLLAWKARATQNAADGDFALLIGLNRYVVGDLPVTN